MLKSLFNWKVLLNVVIAASLFVGLVYLTFRWLEYHTKHGQEVPVPGVMNMSVQNAIKTLEDVGLKQEVDSFKFNPKYKPFQVLDVFPKPGSRVKEGRVVRLKVNPRSWAPVQVPDILDSYKNLAYQRLDQIGLSVGDTLYEPNVQKDAVIRMMYDGNTLQPGTMLPRFSTIDLIIGSGPLTNIPVPNVIGMTVGEAKNAVKNNLFEIGVVEFDHKDHQDSDIIYYQDPKPGVLRDQGMQVDLWASTKTPAELQSRIDYLNTIYRMEVDTFVTSGYNTPSYTPSTNNSVKKKKKDSTSTVKSSTQNSEEKKPGVDQIKNKPESKLAPKVGGE